MRWIRSRNEAGVKAGPGGPSGPRVPVPATEEWPTNCGGVTRHRAARESQSGTRYATCRSAVQPGEESCDQKRKPLTLPLSLSLSLQPCPDPQDFRAHQCSAYDEVPYDGVLYKWTPHYDYNEPCALTCRWGDRDHQARALRPTFPTLGWSGGGGESPISLLVGFSRRAVALWAVLNHSGTECLPWKSVQSSGRG